MSRSWDAALAARLKVVVKQNGGNKAVAEASGISLGALNNYLRLVNDPSAASLVKIAAACGVSLEWLATGKSASDKTSAPRVPFRVHAIIECDPRDDAKQRYLRDKQLWETKAIYGGQLSHIARAVVDKLKVGQPVSREWLEQLDRKIEDVERVCDEAIADFSRHGSVKVRFHD